MVTEKARVSDYHFDHKLWVNELQFFESQLNIFEERLEDVIRNLNDHTAMAESEAFQNQIIRQREVIDELKHKFRLREKDLDTYDSNMELDADHPLFVDHEKEHEDMDMFIKLYSEMRDRYMAFLKSWA